MLIMEESGEQCIVVFAWIFTKLASGEGGCWGVAAPSLPQTRSLAGSVTINAKTTLHCSLGSSMLLRKFSPATNQFRLINFFLCVFGSVVLAGSRLMPTGQCLIFVISFYREIVSLLLLSFSVGCEGNQCLDPHTPGVETDVSIRIWVFIFSSKTFKSSLIFALNFSRIMLHY